MKTFLHTLLAMPLAFAAATLHAQEPLTALPRLSGRVQYVKNPGAGSGAMKFIDSPLPQPEIRVGPTRESGVAMGALLAFKTTPEIRRHIADGSRLELLIDVDGTSRGGAPADLVVALLNTGSTDDHSAFVHFGAWNNAANFAEVGILEADPEKGLHLFNITEALRAAATQPTEATPVIWFAIYLPEDKIAGGQEGEHVILGGNPRIIVRPGR
ncbi:MAG: hypothetical protein JJU05_00235 [Verrucomicrobia bacterium]|nr:hypothetical protein [Verrucomicrobiota bacterium]MCH8526255.1 hypothetical protein [Kiritimatiellia bacterium]